MRWAGHVACMAAICIRNLVGRLQEIKSLGRLLRRWDYYDNKKDIR